jgi:predicted nucleotide-binding protein
MGELITDEEYKYLLLTKLNQLINNNPKFDIELNFLASKLGWETEINTIEKYLNILSNEKAVSLKYTNGDFQLCYITLTEQTNNMLTEKNNIPLSEMAMQLLNKSYECYKRNNSLSNETYFTISIANCIGISNISRINNAFEILNNAGYVKDIKEVNDFQYQGYKSFMLSASGIDFIERKMHENNNFASSTKLITSSSNILETNNYITNSDIFIVHGRDEGILAVVKNFLLALKLNPIILHEKANEGKTIIEKFEKYSNVQAAIALYTSDDVGKYKEDEKLEIRARQNVIFEAGYFIGKLGRERTIILFEEGLTIHSDLDGFIYIPLDRNQGWHSKLAKELKSLSFNIDMNDLL